MIEYVMDYQLQASLMNYMLYFIQCQWRILQYGSSAMPLTIYPRGVCDRYM